MDASKIGKRIQEERRKRGVTQQELAEKLGMTAKYISNIECGSKTPKLEIFVAIANALQVDANTLLVDSLAVSGEIRCSGLWERMSAFSPEKREKLLRMLSMLADDM